MRAHLWTPRIPLPKSPRRNDAGIGSFLKGDGKGNFKAIPADKSGLCLKGDVKQLKSINLNNKKAIIAAKNNDYLQIITTHKNN